MSRELRRKTPEELLREVEAQESPKGHLKIFLGYASGVGKSFRMLDEARRRLERGQDVVIGAVQHRMQPEVSRLLSKLEVVPLKEYGSGLAMNVDAILRRHPAVCIIDGLAHNNPPELRNPTRWQDVQDLVNAGIKVVGSINIQYIDEMRERVEAVTGKHVEETVPVSFIRSADEIEIVDAPPEEPLERSPEQQIDADKRQERLSLLREMALVLAADMVDQQLNSYLGEHGIRHHFGAQERILVCITPRANARGMIEAARTTADRFHAEMVAAYVRQPGLSPGDSAAIEEKLEMARNAGARIEILEGEDPVDALLDFAKSSGITQLFIGHTQKPKGWFRSDPVDSLIQRSRGMDVRVFPQ